jgi:hypothetical protein
MKVIDRSPYRDEDGSIALNERMRGTWQFGLAWNKEIQAQDKLIDHLHALLDNQYTLIRDIFLPKLEIPIPVVLIGPTGVRVFYASALQGIYRVRENSLLVLDKSSRQYRPSQPNLIKRTALMSYAILTFLNSKGYPVEEVEPVLFFSDPNIHVDAKDPAVRILLTDGIDRFVEKFSQDLQQIDSTLVKRISDTLASLNIDRSAQKTQKKLGIGTLLLYRWQWLVLAILVILQLCMMLIFILIIFMVN